MVSRVPLVLKPGRVAQLGTSEDLDLTGRKILLGGSGSVQWFDEFWSIRVDNNDGMIFSIWDGNDRKYRFRNADLDIEVFSIDPDGGAVTTTGPINLEHASDTPITRVAAGRIAVAGDELAKLVDLADVATGKGASLIGIEDADALFTATTVEDALKELADAIPGMGSYGTAATLDFDTDGTLAANSDALIATQKATKTYADTKVTGAGAVTDSHFAQFDGTTGKLLKGGIALDTDTALAANSDTKIASQKAVKAYVDGIIAAQDAMVFKGVIDASSNPNYPAADRGHTYRISVAGKIGGASGPNVEVGDVIICLTDSTSSGNHATVGSNWSIIQNNLDGAVIGPASSTDAHFAQFDGTSGKLLKGGIALDTDTALAADSDTRVASQKATKAYADTKISPSVTANLTKGYTATGYSGGTVSSGTYTPDPANGNLQYYTNNGAHTLAPPSATGDYTIIVQITNSGSAGAITTSSYTKVTGDPFTTTNGHDFLCFITKLNGFTHLHVQALQ